MQGAEAFCVATRTANVSALEALRDALYKYSTTTTTTTTCWLLQKHRVLIPEDLQKRQQIRRSVVFFVAPDDDVIVKCLDGSDKYQPVNGIEYVTRLDATVRPRYWLTLNAGLTIFERSELT